MNVKSFVLRTLERSRIQFAQTLPLSTLDAIQDKPLMGALFLLYEQRLLYLGFRLAGMKHKYWRIHRNLYGVLHHGEKISWF